MHFLATITLVMAAPPLRESRSGSATGYRSAAVALLQHLVSIVRNLDTSRARVTEAQYTRKIDKLTNVMFKIEERRRERKILRCQ